MVFIWSWYRRENKRKAALQARPDYVRLENQEYVFTLQLLIVVIVVDESASLYADCLVFYRWLDLTDRENPDFMYSL